MRIPKLADRLTKDDLFFLDSLAQSARHSIIAMLKNSQSGHPGGSLGCIDYLALLYGYVLSQKE